MDPSGSPVAHPQRLTVTLQAYPLYWGVLPHEPLPATPPGGYRLQCVDISVLLDAVGFLFALKQTQRRQACFLLLCDVPTGQWQAYLPPQTVGPDGAFHFRLKASDCPLLSPTYRLLGSCQSTAQLSVIRATLAAPPWDGVHFFITARPDLEITALLRAGDYVEEVALEQLLSVPSQHYRLPQRLACLQIVDSLASPNPLPHKENE